jgi:hypothetical protein
MLGGDQLGKWVKYDVRLFSFSGVVSIMPSSNDLSDFHDLHAKRRVLQTVRILGVAFLYRSTFFSPINKRNYLLNVLDGDKFQ